MKRKSMLRSFLGCLILVAGIAAGCNSGEAQPPRVSIPGESSPSLMPLTQPFNIISTGSAAAHSKLFRVYANMGTVYQGLIQGEKYGCSGPRWP